MERFISLFRLGIKYLYRYKRRYAFLFTALVFCFAVVTLITSVKDGMYDSVYYSAQSHYAGDIIVSGYDHASTSSWRHLTENEIRIIRDTAENSGINPKNTVLRTTTDGIVFFNGSAVELKYLLGCDWEAEAPLFGRMNYAEAPGLFHGEDCIVLSYPGAKQLGAAMGDRIILEVETRTGQKNTGSFIVKGIVKDSSIFGYHKAYISRLALNNLVTNDAADCSTIGFFFDDPGSAEQKRKVLQEALSGKLQMGPLLYTRDELDEETAKRWEGKKFLLFTMPVFLSEISDLLNALNILT